MQAWKCDRCGKLYAQIAERGKVNSMRLRDISVVRIGWVNPDVHEMYYADLCEECAKDFVLWFKEPALAAITNEEKL